MAEELYAKDGVNIDEEDRYSKYCYEVCKSTYQNVPYVIVDDWSEGHFQGPRTFRLNTKEYPFLKKCSIMPAPDTNGTKGVLSVLSGNLSAAAQDIVAVGRTDISRYGGYGAVMSDVLITETLGTYPDATSLACRTLIDELGSLANKEGFIVFNGESCQVGEECQFENPHAVLKFHWVALFLGIFHPSRIIRGRGLREGLLVIALNDQSLGTNGLSSARAALRMRFGDCYWENPDAQESIKAAAAPSALYDRLLMDANGWFDWSEPLPIELIAHNSGGALRKKFAKLLFKLGLSADLPNLYAPPKIMRDCFEWRGMTDEEAYKVWHCGQRAFVVIEENRAADFLDLASSHRVGAWVCGRITKRPTPSVRFISKFTGKHMEYFPE